MKQPSASARTRQLEEIAEALPQRVASLSQLLLTGGQVCVSRSEIGVLRRLSCGSRRITELAADENLTQPGITLLVNRLQQRGWVNRASDPADGRAVQVALTADGEAALAALRAEYRALLQTALAGLDDGELDTLAAAVQILAQLVEHLDGTVR